MNSEQLQLMRRINAVKKTMGTALKSTGGMVTGGLEVKDQLKAAGGMAVDGGMNVTGLFKAAGAFTAGDGRLVVPADSTGALKMNGALEAGDGRLVIPADSTDTLELNGAVSAGGGRLVIPANSSDALRLTGTLSAGGGRLVLPSSTSQNMTLDGKTVWHAGNLVVDSEDWTPTLYGSTSGSATLDRAEGQSLRIADIVICNVRIRTLSTSALSGALRIGGLPYRASGNIYMVPGATMASGFTTSNLVNILVSVAEGNTYLQLIKHTVTSSGTIAMSSVYDSNVESVCEIRGSFSYRI